MMLYPLFIYGTLHPDRAPATIAATARLLKPFGRRSNLATIRGRIYSLGEYPGLVLSTGPDDPSGNVAGELFTIPDDPQVLIRFDEYEDFRPNDPANSLFLRQLTTATMADGTIVSCWVYTYNRPLN